MGRSKSPPPVIQHKQISHQLPPLNFAKIFDQLSGDKLEIMRDAQGKMQLTFANNNKERIDLEKPVQAGNINSRLPGVTPIEATKFNRIAEIAMLSDAMRDLDITIKEMQQTAPHLVTQHQTFIDNYSNAMQKVMDRGFDIREYAVSELLAKNGVNKGSSAFGAQLALAKERSYFGAQLELQKANMAVDLKEQALNNLYKRGGLLSDRLKTESASELTARGQDIQAQEATQQLQQQQAAQQVALELQANQQRIDTDFRNKASADERRKMMVGIGTDAFNQGTNASIAAASTDNNGIANTNAANLATYKATPASPLQLAANTFLGNAATAIMGGPAALATKIGSSMIDRIIPPVANKEKV